MTPSIPKPPFDLPPTERDETAPRSLPICVKENIKPRKDYTHNARSERHEVAARQNLAAARHQKGIEVDVNLIPLDKLFR